MRFGRRRRFIIVATDSVERINADVVYVRVFDLFRHSELSEFEYKHRKLRKTDQCIGIVGVCDENAHDLIKYT